MDILQLRKKMTFLETVHVDKTPDLPVRNPPIVKLIRFGFGTLGYFFPKKVGSLAFHFFSTPRIRARHKVSDEIIERAKVFEFLYEKQILKGYEWGQGDRTILLVHGWESRGTALRTFVPDLVAQGYRVLAFDGPAHGNSGGKQTNLIHFAGAVRAAIRQAGKVHGIITHSFGGASTVFALSNLEPSIAVEKLVLIAVPDSMEKVLSEAIQTMNVPKPAAAVFFKMVEQRLKQPLREANTSNAYQRLNIQETLLVYDRLDPIVPFEAGHRIYEKWASISFLISEGLGHYRMMKNPDVIKHVVEFVTSDSKDQENL